jgi:uncharacterized membrane protein
VHPSVSKRTLALVSGYQWLLMLHVTGAFFLLGGSIVAALLSVLSLRTSRPSEIAQLLGLIRFALPVLLLGSLLTIVLGLWLVHHVGYSFGAFWVWGAIVLWVAANGLGQMGGKKQEQARKLARQLAGEGDGESAELRALLRDPVANAMSWGAGVAIYLILVLMIWKPGQ